MLDQSCRERDCVSAFHPDTSAPLHDELVGAVREKPSLHLERGHPLEIEVCENQPTVAASAMSVGVRSVRILTTKWVSCEEEGGVLSPQSSWLVVHFSLFCLCCSLRVHFIFAQH